MQILEVDGGRWQQQEARGGGWSTAGAYPAGAPTTGAPTTDNESLGIMTPVSHLVVYHVILHGATSHMGIHMVKVDKLNHDKNHVVIHVVLQRKSNVLEY